MAGNVSEMVHDPTAYFHRSFPSSKPTRGGSFMAHSTTELRATTRDYETHEYSPMVGFRCVYGASSVRGLTQAATPVEIMMLELGNPSAEQTRWLAEVRPSAKNCRARPACSVSGRCGYDPAKKRCATARTDSDCAASQLCRLEGACVARGDACVVGSDEDCERAAVCKDFGECRLVGDACVVQSDQDCEQSRECRAIGACVSRKAGNRPTNMRGCRAKDDAACARSARCARNGWCAVARDGCSGTTVDHCRNSAMCKLHGQCHVDEHGWCVVGTNDNCRSAELCRMDGACQLENGACVANEQSCKASIRCETLGICDAHGGFCVHPKRLRSEEQLMPE